MASAGSAASARAGADELPDTVLRPAGNELRAVLFFPSQATIAEHCEATVRVERTVTLVGSVEASLLGALFAGLTAQERATGLFSPLHGNVRDRAAAPLGEHFRGVIVTEGVARLDFAPAAMDYLNQAACAQTAVKSAIENTLRQLPNVRQIEYSVDGRVVNEWDA